MDEYTLIYMICVEDRSYEVSELNKLVVREVQVRQLKTFSVEV